MECTATRLAPALSGPAGLCRSPPLPRLVADRPLRNVNRIDLIDLLERRQHRLFIPQDRISLRTANLPTLPVAVSTGCSQR